ncbi:MAG: hypothetical protein M5U12_13945 [Verrucomicrobia bacterium]|nr:hypothetical protein [Verrucomicrobiota bacterium]
MDRLWQESWGPENYEQQMQRSRRLRAYGLAQLIQCNHEITWRDAGESFTLRTRAAPRRGGDAALARYVAHQRDLGWLSGLYSNYTDFAPVNEHWSPDWVQRMSDGNWRTAWPRNYALKPLKAVEFDALLAPQIKEKFQPNSAYTDVHTAVAPWNYVDYDARVPGAGTFAQTLYAYGELLRHDSEVYGGPVFSEGTYHWLYAGLADGNYALVYDGRPLALEPLLPVFDLLELHPKQCDIGMGWTAHFCDPLGDWKRPENLDRAIDRFLLHTLAYGHIGWLVEEAHGIDRTCRSYYMLQQVQARYGLQAPNASPIGTAPSSSASPRPSCVTSPAPAASSTSSTPTASNCGSTTTPRSRGPSMSTASPSNSPRPVGLPPNPAATSSATPPSRAPTASITCAAPPMSSRMGAAIPSPPPKPSTAAPSPSRPRAKTACKSS